MFCPHCGVDLPEESTLCPACGDPIATEDISTEPAEEAAPEQTDSLDSLLADVKETFHLEDDAAPAEEADAAEEAPEQTGEESQPEVPASEEAGEEVAEETAEETAEESPEEDTPAEETESEESVYVSQEAEEEPVKKRSGKALRVLVPIFAVLLLLAAATGVFFLASETYDKAAECLAVKDYEQAQELYARFPFFKDSHEYRDLLISQQQAYDSATQLVQQDAYKEALKGYAALGDYRDSQQLLIAEVPYLQACYLKENAAAGNAAALTQLPGYDEASTEVPEVLLYRGAAELFASLGDHQDSAALSSTCYKELATVFMTAGRFEEALACHERMAPADAELSVAEYLTYCEDEALLEDLNTVIRARRQLEEGEEDVTHLQLVNTELDVLRRYVEDEDLMYYNTQLKALIADYVTALETEASTIDEDGFYTDIITWYTGNANRFAVIEQLIETTDLLGDDPALQASFVGKSAYYQAAILVEKELAAQLVGVSAQTGEDIGDHLIFKNTTGYTFTLTVSNDFLDEDGVSVFYHQNEPVSVGVDATVRIPVLFPDNNDWESWKTAWSYKIELP